MEKSYRYIAWFFVLIFLIEIAGFFNSYFSRFPTFSGFLTVHHLHLASLVLWFLMLFIQPVLVYRKNFHAHRIIGKSSYVLIPLIVFFALNVMKYSYNKATSTGVPANQALGFMWISFSALVPFVLIYLLAILYRKQPAYHMRYMVATSVALLGPAIGRIDFGMKDLNSAILFAFLLSDLFLLAMLIFEYLKSKIYQPYLVSLGLCVIFHAPFPWISVSPVWHRIAGAFVRYF